MKWSLIVGGLGLLAVLAAHTIGLFFAPAEAHMGETGRILYVHVPTAWTGMLAFTVAFVGAIGTLWSGSRRWDAVLEAAVEVGVVFSGLTLAQGSIWARPTWDTWWSWDPRLTTAAVMMVAFTGVLILRSTVHNPERRSTFSAVATIISYVDVPIVYFSVEWWDSLHQPLSTANSVDGPMLVPLLASIAGTTLLGVAFGLARGHIAWRRRQHEEAAPDLPETPAPLDLEPRS